MCRSALPSPGWYDSGRRFHYRRHDRRARGDARCAEPQSVRVGEVVVSHSVALSLRPLGTSVSHPKSLNMTIT